MKRALVEANLRLALTDRLPVLSVSDSIETLLGFKPDDFLSARVSLKDRIHPHDADIAAVLFSPEIKNKASTFNIRLRHADGGIRCIKATCSKEAAPGGKVILGLFLQDAKSLRQAQLGEPTMALFKAMMENTGDFIYFKDRNHVFTSANDPVVPTADPRKRWPDLVGLTDYDLLPEEYADYYYQLEKEVFAGKPVASEIQAAPSRDGKGGWLDNRKYPIRDGNGEIVGLFGIARDVTDRRRVEEALRESEESLRESQSIAGLGSYLLDIRTGVWTSSDVLDRLFGIDNGCGRTVADWMALVHPDDRAVMAAYYTDEVVGKRNAFDKEYRIVRQNDRAEHWVHGLGRLEFDAQGIPIKMHGTIQDITGRKLAEAALRESEASLRDAQMTAGLGAYVLDAQAGTWTSSDIMDRLFGIDKEYNRTVDAWMALIHPDDRAAVADCLAKAAHGPVELLNQEYRIIRPSDQAVRWIHSICRPEFDAQGRLLKRFGTVQDITERKLAQAALRESKELLQLFIEHAPAALAMFDREMRYMAVSRRWLENASLTGREVIGRCHYEVHAVPQRWKDAHRRSLAGETVRAEEDRYERADGSVRWLRWEVRPWRTGDGDLGGIIMFSEDITQQKQAEERLRLAASVFTHSREGIVITDLDGNILDVNDTFTRITGYDRDEVLGRNPRLLSSGLHGREFYAEMWRAIKETGQWSGEIWNRHKSGEIYPEMLTINALFGESGDVWQYVALFSDISALKEHERKLEHVAHYDILTGLPNRVLLADRLHQAMAQSRRRDQPLAVAFLDLDGFKAVNDRHGHEAGDQLLTALATRLKQTLRDGDTLARLGGDEFVVVLLDMGDIGLRSRVLNRLLEAVREPTLLGDLVLQVSASLGVTFYPQARDVDADLLLRQADHAMYQAKLAGGNCFHIFDAGNDSIVRGHHEDVAMIRKALAAREFVLYFQPMVNMRTGTVVGAEALIRWQLPERGLMPPAAFLPIIEDDPLAVELGEWVIDTALTQMETWLEDGLDIPVSVNVSAMQLQQANFPDRLRALLAAHPSIEPSRLELEVLETSALQDMAQASQTIHACTEIGVTFALDDFGTGYSSLTYLKRLPSRILKIDQSFVRGILDDAEDLTIIEGVLLLALAFRRMVIAEGVESVEHGMTLLQMGCELAQGYCIARPMPAKDLPSWVASWRPDHRWATAYRERPAKDGSNGIQ
ncbi:MAG: EAL domain-containing protein [Terracidiphilus sp.]